MLLQILLILITQVAGVGQTVDNYTPGQVVGCKKKQPGTQ